jgi:hypothetical protein
MHSTMANSRSYRFIPYSPPPTRPQQPHRDIDYMRDGRILLASRASREGGPLFQDSADSCNRQPTATIWSGEERRLESEEWIRRQEEELEGHSKAEEIRLWLERHRRNKRELVVHTSRERQRVRAARQEQDSIPG